MSSRRNFTFFVSTVVASMALLSGCIIVDGSTNNNTGGGGGAGAQGGSGGEAQGGSGGTGGAIGVGGGGGAGGGANCVGPNDGILDVKSCDAMNITPASAGGTAKLCMSGGAEYNPPGFDYCTGKVFTVFQSGAADVLQKCLAKIPGDAVKSCDVQLVSDCVSEANYAACPTQKAGDHCDAIAKGCQAANPPQAFDAQACQINLNPLLDTTVDAIFTCFNTEAPANLNCQEAHDYCYSAKVLAIP